MVRRGERNSGRAAKSSGGGGGGRRSFPPQPQPPCVTEKAGPLFRSSPLTESQEVTGESDSSSGHTDAIASLIYRLFTCTYHSLNLGKLALNARQKNNGAFLIVDTESSRLLFHSV